MYTESYTPPFMRWVVLVLLCSSAAALYWFVLSEGVNFLSLLGLAGLGLFVALLVSYAMSSYRVELQSRNLHVGFRGWSVQIPVDDIEQATATDIRWLEHGGLGWRISGPKRIGYITKSGPGVQLTVRSNQRTYTFNCEQPEVLIAQLGL